MKYSRPIFIALISLIYFVLYSIAVVKYDFFVVTNHTDKINESAIIDQILYSLESYERAFMLLFFFTIHRVIFAITIPLLFLCSAIAAYFINTFHIQINERSIPLLFETNTHEIAAFSTTYLIIWSASSFLLGLTCVWFFIKQDKKDTKTKRNNVFAFIAGIFSIYTLLFPIMSENSQYMPYNYIRGTANYFLAKYYKIGKQDISTSPISFKGKSLTVVMVIGESARADHFSLNGYSRNTNPNLSKIVNLVNFPQATSCDNLTYLSVPCMLTRATQKNRQPTQNETSFISMFRRLGFDTIWIDNQQAKNSLFNSGITGIMNEANTVISPEIVNVPNDMRSLPVIENILNNKIGNLLIVIHTNGSHWNYDSGYDEKNTKWVPICANAKRSDIVKLKCKNNFTAVNSCNYAAQMAQCESSALINSYDNSILQTDYFLSEVINLLKNRNSILLYSSDHGESLGENGFFLHGQSIDDKKQSEQFHVPMFFWASDEFIKNNPKEFSNAKNKSQKKTSHDIIFHSILNCAGIESEVIDKKLSICE